MISTGLASLPARGVTEEWLYGIAVCMGPDRLESPSYLLSGSHQLLGRRRVTSGAQSTANESIYDAVLQIAIDRNILILLAIEVAILCQVHGVGSVGRLLVLQDDL